MHQIVQDIQEKAMKKGMPLCHETYMRLRKAREVRCLVAGSRQWYKDTYLVCNISSEVDVVCVYLCLDALWQRVPNR